MVFHHRGPNCFRYPDGSVWRVADEIPQETPRFVCVCVCVCVCVLCDDLCVCVSMY